MKVKSSEVKIGNVINYESKKWKVISREHVKPGKGGAYIQMKLKEVQIGTSKEIRFRSDEDVYLVHVTDVQHIYNYPLGDSFVFMNNESYEIIELPSKFVDNAEFLQEGMIVSICFAEDENGQLSPISVKLPDHVECVIEDTQPVIKGQTASSSYKPATLSNGVRTTVPPHVEIGNRVIINTNDRSYVEKTK
ncbi:elongation factor P [Candidatus Gromoviella agglomerans]|uniref:elongation factor P n=1 Tax=Candidatus Gromoviella agglomerans TaxID=2806609 RepID=UPI001E51B363|nr:elongation factor P [Candidatus Gromoviella agglomerans]UFX98351.1 Translation elongation factor P [Candidatus Gromoviella agglomerans]